MVLLQGHCMVPLKSGVLLSERCAPLEQACCCRCRVVMLEVAIVRLVCARFLPMRMICYGFLLFAL